MKKLRLCRDPDKVDLVKLNQAQKRDAVADGELEEHKAKKRKIARESHQKEADEFWGPELNKENGAKPSQGLTFKSNRFQLFGQVHLHGVQETAHRRSGGCNNTEIKRSMVGVKILDTGFSC